MTHGMRSLGLCTWEWKELGRMLWSGGCIDASMHGPMDRSRQQVQHLNAVGMQLPVA